MEKRYAIGNFICQLRQEKGLTQKELGELLGVTNKAVSKWETGVAMPRLEYLQRLAAILGCTQEELFLGGRLPTDDPLKQPADVMAEYRSVVQRCDACSHKVKRIQLRKPMKCLHCGAELQLHKIWELIYLLFVILLCTQIMGYCGMFALNLTALCMENIALPIDKIDMYLQLHQILPQSLLDLYGFCTFLVIHELGCVVIYLILKLVNLLLRGKKIFRISHYPHVEDGKIID